MPEIISVQRTDDWLLARQGRVTASLAAACLGLDPYLSSAAAWRKIMGEPNRTNRHMRWGIQFEDQARLDYEAESGLLVQVTGLWVHPKHDWLAASPDGLVGAGLVEIKCPGSLPVAVPLHHRIQMLVQMSVTGRAWCDYYAWTHAGSFLRRVHAAGIDGIITKLHQFYRNFVVPAICPPRKLRKKKG